MRYGRMRRFSAADVRQHGDSRMPSHTVQTAPLIPTSKHEINNDLKRASTDVQARLMRIVLLPRCATRTRARYLAFMRPLAIL